MSSDTLLYAGGDGYDFVVVDSASQAVVNRGKLGSSNNRRFALSPTDNLLAVGGLDAGTEMYNSESLQRTGVIPGSALAVSFSHDGTKLAVGKGSASPYDVRIYDAHTQELKHSLLGHTGCIWHVDFSPNDERIVSAGCSEITLIHDVASGAVVRLLKDDGTQRILTSIFLDDDRIATGRDQATMSVWDVHTGERLHSLNHAGGVYGLDVSPDRLHFASGSWGKRVIVWDAQSCTEVRSFQLSGSISALFFATNEIVVASVTNASLAFINISTGDVSTAEVKLNGSIYGLAGRKEHPTRVLHLPMLII